MGSAFEKNRFTHREVLAIAALGFVPWFMLVGAVAYLRWGSFAPWTLILAVIVPLVLVSIGALLGSRKMNRMVEGARLSRELDGLVCPHCHRRPSVAPGEPRCCPNAPSDWTAEDYRAWWEALRGGSIHAQTLPTDEVRLRGWNAWRPGLGALMFGNFGLFSRGLPGAAWDWVSVVESVLPYALLGYALEIGARGWSGWQAKRLLCAGCKYPKQPSIESPRCPECGRDWHAPGGTTLQRTRMRPRFLVAAGAAAVLGLALIYLMGTGGAPWLRRIQTTNGLIRAATSGGPTSFGGRNAAWNELTRRTLTPDEAGRLFDAVLDLRQHSRILFGPPALFVTGHVATGQITADQERRLRIEGFTPKLVVPASARVGEPFDVTVRGERFEEFLPPAHGISVYLGGAWFEEEPPQPTAGGRGHWTLEIDQGKAIPTASLRSEAPGERTVVVRLWLVARRYGLLDNPIEWNEDATPILPADGLWAERVDLRGTIRITP